MHASVRPESQANRMSFTRHLRYLQASGMPMNGVGRKDAEVVAAVTTLRTSPSSSTPNSVVDRQCTCTSGCSYYKPLYPTVIVTQHDGQCVYMQNLCAHFDQVVAVE